MVRQEQIEGGYALIPFGGPHIGVTYQRDIVFVLDTHYAGNCIVFNVAPKSDAVVGLLL